MKNFLKISIYVFFALFIYSCSSSSDVVSNSLIQKRKFNKGFHSQFVLKQNKPKSNVVAKSTIEKSEIVQTSVVEELDKSLNTIHNLSASNNSKFVLITGNNSDIVSTKNISEETIKSFLTPKQLKKIANKIEKIESAQINSNGITDHNSSEKSTGIDVLLLIIIAILLPPLAVALASGKLGLTLLNILLTLLFILPGIIHALIVVVNNK